MALAVTDNLHAFAVPEIFPLGPTASLNAALPSHSASSITSEGEKVQATLC